MRNPFKRKTYQYMRACYITASGNPHKDIWLPYSRKEHKKLKQCMRHNMKVLPTIYNIVWIEYAHKQEPQKNPVNYHAEINTPAQSRIDHQTKPSN